MVLFLLKEKCLFLSHAKAKKVYPDQTAPKELSDQDILYLQKTTQVITSAE